MTENQALILDVVVGLAATLGCFAFLGALGVDAPIQAAVGIMGLSVTCLMIGAIDVHYTRKAIERGEDPDGR